MRDFFSCSCYDIRHNIAVDGEPDDPDYDEVEIHVSLNHWLPWYSRIIPAARFLLGLEDRRSHYCCVLLTQEDIKRMIKTLNKHVRRES